MKQIIINLYSFDELSDEAKEKAIEQCRQTSDFWESENRDSLRKFCDIFPCSIKRGFESHSDNDHAYLSGIRLAKYIWNNYKDQIYAPKQYWICEGRPNTVGINSKHRNSKIFMTETGCVLTGFYIDNEILAPLFDFMRKPDNTTFEQLLSECYQAWKSACQKDYEYQISDEATIETIKCNEYTFTEDGTLNNG